MYPVLLIMGYVNDDDLLGFRCPICAKLISRVGAGLDGVTQEKCSGCLSEPPRVTPLSHNSDVEIEEFVLRSRSAQELPPAIEDPVVLGRLIALLRPPISGAAKSCKTGGSGDSLLRNEVKASS